MHTCGPRYLRGPGERMAWAQEVKAAVNCVCATALQPEWLSVSQQTNKQNPTFIDHSCKKIFWKKSKSFKLFLNSLWVEKDSEISQE